MAQFFGCVNTSMCVCLAALVSTAGAGAQPYAYVAVNGSNAMAVLNLSSYAMSATLAVPWTPAGIAVTPDGSTVYISSSYFNNVTALRTSDNTVIATMSVGTTPQRLAVSPNGALVYVVDYASGQVSVINHAIKAVTATIKVGSRPSSVAFSPDSTRAYVTNLFSSNVSVIDTASSTVVGTFNSGAQPAAVAVTADGQHLYVANQGANTVTVHDASGNLQATIPGFVAPDSVAIAPNGKVFVANGNGNSVSIIDPASNTVIAKPSVGLLPTSVAISTNGTQALVTNENNFTVSIIDTSSYGVVRTIANVGTYPIAIAMQPAALAGGGGGGGAFSPIRVNAGGSSMTDSGGNLWQADPGRSYNVTMAAVTNNSPAIYQKAAYAGGAGLTYTFGVPNGNYTVTLHFAETYETSAGRRLMNISINNQTVASNVDVFAQAGMNAAYSPSYSTSVSNGQITITISSALAGGTAMLSGLEIH